jgi:hypothetical protein
MAAGTLNVIDIEKDIEKRFVYGLRAIFEIDDFFIYNEDDTKTKVMITPEYPEKGSSFYTPHIVVTNISYQYNMQSSFRDNYYYDLADTNGVHIGEAHANLVPYTLNLICLAEFYVSKDLANKVLNYMGYVAREVFDKMNLNIQTLSKSPTVAQQQWAEHIFETQVAVQGYVQWYGTKTTNISALNILNRIEQTLKLKF